MTSASTYRSWSGPARTMALAIDAAVSAARAGEAEAFTDALTGLARVDHEQRTVLLGTVTRDLIERAHPDGLDSDDAQNLLRRAAAASAWYSAFDPDTLVRALTDALGVSDPDEAVQVDGTALSTHGLLLVADLLTTLDQPLAPVLELALNELRREQTIELP